MFSRVSLALKSQNLWCSIFYFTICSFFYLNFAKSLIFDFYFTTFSPLHVFYQSKRFPSIFSIASKALISQNFLYLIFILRFSHPYMFFLSMKRFSVNFFKCIQRPNFTKSLVFLFFTGYLSLDLIFTKSLLFNFYLRICLSLHLLINQKVFP